MRLERSAWTGKPINSDSILGAMVKFGEDYMRVVTGSDSGVTKITLDALWKNNVKKCENRSRPDKRLVKTEAGKKWWPAQGWCQNEKKMWIDINLYF